MAGDDGGAARGAAGGPAGAAGGPPGAASGVVRTPVTIIVDGANVVGSRPDGWWRDRAGAAVRLYDDLARLAARGAAGIPARLLVTSNSPPGGGAGAGAGGERPAGAGASGAGGGCHRDGGASGSSGRASDGAAEPADAVLEVAVVLVLEGAARAAEQRIARQAAAAEGTRGAGDVVAPGTVRVVVAPGSGDDEIVRLAASLPGRRIVVTADRELRRRCLAVGAEVAGPSWLFGLL
jgi:hypothetical protein